MKTHDLTLLTLLDMDVLGTTYLARDITSKLHAVKVLKRDDSLYQEPEQTLSTMKHPCILELRAILLSSTCIHMVMEFAAGGTLMGQIRKAPFGTERARFYAAEICLGLKYLHENGIVHRNLSLENVAVTKNGHVKITGFEFCKTSMWHKSRTASFCGTSTCFAPEVLLDKTYGRSVDWWAFGIIIHEMVYQRTPFTGDDEDEIYDAIVSKLSSSIPIVQELLVKEPENRLGCSERDALELMEHSFFESLDWNEVLNWQVPVPFVPHLETEYDLSCFENAQPLGRPFSKPCDDW